MAGEYRDQPGWSELTRSPVLVIAFGLGTGLSARAPGTFGTLLAIPLWWALSAVDPVVYLLIAGCAFVFGVWICDRAVARLARHDHPGIVIDEIVGFLVALAAVPLNLGWLIAAFVLFRFFDIVKPWPISWLDREVRGGLGVMLDDLAAGAATAGVIIALRLMV